jgi:putative transcriptional regulator
MVGKVKGYRNIAGLTQEELAKKLEISVQCYRNKENGRVAFKDSEKIIIRDLLGQVISGIKVDDIFF